MRKAVLLAFVVAAALLSTTPGTGTSPDHCSSAAEEGGACPRHGFTGGGTPFVVDCDQGLAFIVGFSNANTHIVYIPQLEDGDDAPGDVFLRSQKDAGTHVFIFDPLLFPADPIECAIQVGRAVSGLFPPFNCLSHADCPEGTYCLGPGGGCVYPCGSCPGGFFCAPGFGRCIMPRIAIGSAQVVETRRATGPTIQVFHVTAQGILDLLEHTGFYPEIPTGEKVTFRGNAHITFDWSRQPVEKRGQDRAAGILRAMIVRPRGFVSATTRESRWSRCPASSV